MSSPPQPSPATPQSMPCSAQVRAQQSECAGTQTPVGSLPQKPPQLWSAAQVPQSIVPQQPSDAGPQV
jgi:hypothetical protein